MLPVLGNYAFSLKKRVWPQLGHTLVFRHRDLITFPVPCLPCVARAAIPVPALDGTEDFA